MSKTWQGVLSTVLVCAGVTFGASARASEGELDGGYSAPRVVDLSGMDMARAADEFSSETKHFSGEWKDAKSWAGALCNGSYQYTYHVQGDVSKVDFELNEKGAVDVHAEIQAIHVGGSGNFRSDLSFCLPLGGWLGVATDSAVIEANAVFEGEGAGLKDMKLRILSSKLGTIHLGKAVPAWFERFVTRQANRALAVVWRTRLGSWLSAKISDYIKKQIPANRQ